MITRRRLLAALGPAMIASPRRSFALQQPARIIRIGFLGVTSASLPASVIRVEALRAGLRDLGYVEGKNLTLEFRWAEGRHERLPELAAELVRLKVVVIVAQGTQGVSAAKQATTTIPIVMPVVADPVDTGLVASLARPGGNVTGLTWFSQEVSAKRLELLKDAVPRTLEIQPFEVRGPSELESAFAAIVVKRADAVTIIEDAILIANAKAIANLAVKNRLPLVAFNEVVEAGGLMAYGADFPEMFQRAATYVDKILKGAKPGELPIERATKFDLVINLKTAHALGLTIPRSILLRADRVIE